MANKISINGTVPKNHDYSLAFTVKGKPMGRFSIADSRNIAPKDAEPDFVTQFWDVRAWGEAAQAVVSLNPSDKIRVEDALVEHGEYEHKTLKHDDGTPYKVKTVQVVVHRAEQILIQTGQDEKGYPSYTPLTVEEEF